MNQPAAQVRNAADSKQVRNAARKERDRRALELRDLREVLAIESGRRVLWRIITHCAPMENPTHQRGDMTHQNIGRQDVGRFIWSEITDADEEKILLMMREARMRERNERIEAEAVQQRNTDDGDNNAS